MNPSSSVFSRHRFLTILAILLLIVGLVVGRLFYLAEIDKSFLRDKGMAEADHPLIVPAYRGLILDRNGIPLAISAPIDNIVFDPKVLIQSPASWEQLASNSDLGLSFDQIKAMLSSHANSQYFVAKRNLPPAVAEEIASMQIPGVYIEKKHESFYPFGPAIAQLIGFTDFNDTGQDGLELAFNKQLQAVNGRELVTENALGQVLTIDSMIKRPSDGQNLTISIDSRIQYAAYEALENEVTSTQATSGSVVVLDPQTGEVLAAVSYPSFNPNSYTDRSGTNVKDRAITDTFEPGSTMKVITLAAALDSGKYTATTPIDTDPGFFFVDGNKIRDDGNYGLIDTTAVLTKSSNVGISKIALSLPRETVYSMFTNLGIGSSPSGMFPGEANGFMYPADSVGDFQFATMTFGYSVSVSLLQLARVYAAIANNGILLPVSFLKIDSPPSGTRAMSAKTAQTLIQMLQTVVGPGGTGILANIPGYEVAGKTGTAHQVNPQGGYYRDRYNALFVGLAPADNPRVVIAVRIDNPQGYYNSFGGVSAAPVFAQVAQQAMHVLGIPPDKSQVNQVLFKSQQQLLQEVVEA
ncbi:MAG: penicillin-binding protein [Gammaproteobacteria bacterium]|jgi:cell division protein FtsI (penicillin-binding protein 3)|nr:penicillin-binding protein [Gammaproteobacteria bacterium]